MKVRSHFEIFVQGEFSAAHHLRGYPGDCARSHGHNWIVGVYIKCDKLNTLGIGIDFRDVKRALKDVLIILDHNDLNTLHQFKDVNPSSENIAKYIYRELKDCLNNQDTLLTKVSVAESPTSVVYYWED
jgi:6-pyruvoyltetrahydropterin/6-carboxytetrahydropterin synthase